MPVVRANVALGLSIAFVSTLKRPYASPLLLQPISSGKHVVFRSNPIIFFEAQSPSMRLSNTQRFA
jgi:hypothetical protein